MALQYTKPAAGTPKHRKFQETKLFIVHHPQGRATARAEAFQDFSTQERKEYFEWSAKQAVDKICKSDSVPLSKEPLTVQSYRDELLAVIWSSDYSVENFYIKTQRSYYPNFGAEPVFLGEDNKFRYYLRPEAVFTDVPAPTQDEPSQHRYINEMRCDDGSKPPCPLGYCLGTLYFAAEDFSLDRNTPPNENWLTKTPFRVWLDVRWEFKHLWIVMDEIFRDDFDGEYLGIGAQVDAWSFLPSPQEQRPSFEALRLLPIGIVGRMSGFHGFFGDFAYGESGFTRSRMRPFSASWNQVYKVTEKTGLAISRSETNTKLEEMASDWLLPG